jgi:hypothetical protein
LTSIHHAAKATCAISGTDVAIKLCSIKTAATHFEYEIPLYIAILYFPKTINKLGLAIAIAADIGMNKTLAGLV